MPTVDNIDVRILVDNQPLREYQAPNGDTDDTHQKVRYIESVAGQKFRVRFRLLPDFDLVNRRIRWFTTELRIDDGKNVRRSSYHVEALEHRNGYLLTTKVYECGGAICWDDDLGDWEGYDFEFGALGTSKTLCYVPSDRS